MTCKDCCHYDVCKLYSKATKASIDIVEGLVCNTFKDKSCIVELPESHEQFESICELVHNAWWDEKKAQGVTGHPDMIPYGNLSEDVKEYDRVTVRAVIKALKERENNA